MEEERKPLVKFKIDTPVSGKFIFDAPLEGESKFGPWAMYKYETANGDEETFSASKGLHKTLQEAGNLKGKKFTITKVLLKDENGNIQESDKGQPILTFDVKFSEHAVGEEPVSAGDVGFPPNFDEM
jgi:hypothetical protein